MCQPTIRKSAINLIVEKSTHPLVEDAKNRDEDVYLELCRNLKQHHAYFREYYQRQPLHQLNHQQ